MVRCVRIWRGEWKKNDREEWDFITHPEEIGYRVCVDETLTYGVLDHIIRQRYGLTIHTPVVITNRLPVWMLIPMGSKTPPTPISDTSQLSNLLNERTWLEDLAFLVVMGPKGVAEYEYLCRTNFTIGTTNYVFDETATENSRAAYESLVFGDRLAQTERVMNAIFPEDAMRLFHRVLLEMEFADHFLANRNRNNQPPREIIELDDNDEEMAEGNQAHVTQGLAAIANQMLGPITQEEAPPICWEVGMDLVNYQEHAARQEPSEEEIENGMRFWEGVANEQTITEANLNANANVIPEGVLDEGRDSRGIGAVVPDSVLHPIIRLDEGAGSSIGSNKYQTDDHDDVTDRIVSMGNTAIIQPTIDEMVAAEGLVLAKTKIVESAKTLGQDQNPTPTALPSMMKLAICCAAKEGGSNATAKETSSEGSSTEDDIGDYTDDVQEGMMFRNRDAFKQHMAIYAIKKKFQYRSPKSEPGLMVLECCGRECPWRVYAVKLKDADVFEIRKVVSEHLCSVDERGGYQTQATTSVIGELMRGKFGGACGGPKPREIRQMMRGDHDVNISYWKAWRSRDVAIDKAKGTNQSSYQQLPGYLERLVAANPGSIAELFTEEMEGGGRRFKYMFVAFGASIKGFQFMRKVVVVDGTHLKGKYAGCLLTASAQDGNYQIFPLAFAIVDSENDASWEWFFQQLSAFVVGDEDLVFVSDRHTSIFKGVSKVYPRAGHCLCVVHLKRNIRSNFKARHLEFLVAKAARTFRLQEFYATFNEIKSMDAACAEYLLEIGLEHWARSHFQGKRYNIMTSNLAESWNSVLREAREYPVIPLIDFIRSKLTGWFAVRREAADKNRGGLTPKVAAILSKNFELSGGYEVTMIAEAEYEVRNKNGGSNHVDLINKTCSCYEFQMLAIPCSHTIAAAIKGKVSVESLVLEAYTVDALKSAYGESVLPVPDIGDVSELVTGFGGMNLYPPLTRRPPGRPKKQRFFSRGEKILKRIRRRTLCSRCKGFGHNKATCKEPI